MTQVALNTVDVDVLQCRERKLDEPLWEKPTGMESLLRTSKITKKLLEGSSRLVKVDDRLVLAPKAWLKQHHPELLDSNAWSGHVKLSSAYEAFDDDFSADLVA